MLVYLLMPMTPQTRRVIPAAALKEAHISSISSTMREGWIIPSSTSIIRSAPERWPLQTGFTSIVER